MIQSLGAIWSVRVPLQIPPQYPFWGLTFSFRPGMMMNRIGETQSARISAVIGVLVARRFDQHPNYRAFSIEVRKSYTQEVHLVDVKNMRM
jgi:hypothetical protein